MEARLIKVLENQGFEYSAALIAKARIDIETSSNYTSGGLFCCAATLVLYLPLDEFSRITSNSILKTKVSKQILNAAKLVEPPKDNGIDILNIRYEYDNSLDIDISVESTNAVILNEDYLDRQLKKCKDKLSTSDYDGVITSSRALLESILIKIIEDKDQTYKYDGNLMKLFKLVSKNLNLEPKTDSTESIKQILTGFSSVIFGMANYRNEYGDAHGKSKKQVAVLKKRHATLALNSTLTICDYLIAYINDKAAG